MKIDRTRFLLLASSLAAASAAAVVSTTGCNTVTKDDADSGPTTEGTGDSGPTTEGGDSGPTTEGGDAAAEAGKCLGDSPDGGPNCNPEANGGPGKVRGLALPVVEPPVQDGGGERHLRLPPDGPDVRGLHVRREGAAARVSGPDLGRLLHAARGGVRQHGRRRVLHAIRVRHGGERPQRKR